MGVDFSHCDASWSYSGFNQFRCRLAEKIRINLGEMVGFGGNREFYDYQDDIIPLINHSDCDGKLTPDECRRVAPRLRELVKYWSDDDYDKRKALELAEGMELAAKNNEDLIFE